MQEDRIGHTPEGCEFIDPLMTGTSLTPAPDLPVTLTEEDYEAIESAVMETARGRWFLKQYAHRNRNADTDVILAALERLENRVETPATAGGGIDRFKLDMMEMATAIARTKAEIASIKPDLVEGGKIGSATEELDIIVATTQSATEDILGAAEEIQEIAWTLREQGFDDKICEKLDERATDIYTSCSFQDLTGQRTKKVVEVLRYLEHRINAVIGIWGLEGAAQPTSAATDEEESLLNGPARPGQGLEQTDVDEMLSPDPTSHTEPAQPAEEAAQQQDDPILSLPGEFSLADLDIRELIAQDEAQDEAQGDVQENNLDSQITTSDAVSLPTLVSVEDLIVEDAPALEPDISEEVSPPPPAPLPVREQPLKSTPASERNFAMLDALGPEEKIALFS